MARPGTATPPRRAVTPPTKPGARPAPAAAPKAGAKPAPVSTPRPAPHAPARPAAPAARPAPAAVARPAPARPTPPARPAPAAPVVEEGVTDVEMELENELAGAEADGSAEDQGDPRPDPDQEGQGEHDDPPPPASVRAPAPPARPQPAARPAAVAAPVRAAPAQAVAVRRPTPIARGAVITPDLLKRDAANHKAQFSTDELRLPRWRILQSNSPQCKEKDPDCIDGAKAGMFFNSLTKAIYDALHVIVVDVSHGYVEWKPNQGGFVAAYGLEEGQALHRTCTLDDSQGKKWFLPNGNQLVEAYDYIVFAFNPDTGDVEQGIFTVSGGGIGTAKTWNSMMQMLMVDFGDGTRGNPAKFYRPYMLTTVYAENEYGSWDALEVTPYNDNIDAYEFGTALYMQAAELADSLREGKVNIAPPGEDDIPF